MNYLKLKKLIKSSEERIISESRKESFWKTSFGNILGSGALILSLFALIYTINAYNLAEDANEETKKSSEKSMEVATKTLDYLRTISDTSNSLNQNLRSFSNTLIPLNQNLLDLTTNLVSVNKLSNDQLISLANILERLTKVNEKLLSISQELDSTRKSLSLRKPEIVFYMDCDFVNTKFDITIKNIGNLKAVVTYQLTDWLAKPDWPSVTIPLSENSTSPSIVTNIYRSWVLPDSTISIPMEISYDSENGGRSASIKYLRCGINKIVWR